MAPTGQELSSSSSRVPLEAVLSTAELSRRESRPADYEAENRALASLMQEMANSPANVLQKLAETALSLCRAHSAGISILEEENGRQIFRWHAVAGRWSGFLGSTMPREISPCGTVLDRNSTLLMSHPERHYPFPPEIEPPIVEVLLTPFHVAGEPVGTIWAIAHDETRRFDGEDQRLLISLGRFASTAYQVLASSHGLEAQLAERKQAEEVQARLAAIVDSSDDAIVGKTLEGIITSWNQGAERLFGYTASEATGQHISLIIPQERRAEEDDVLARLRRGERIDHFETERQAKNGRKIPISLTVSPIRDASGHVIGASKVARDISERKQAEKQLRQTQKLESIGVLAGGIAHDFNNLLTGILGNASLALETLAAGDPARSWLDDVVRASQSAADLTRQMLAYAGKGQFVLESIDLSELVREIGSLIQSSIPRTVQLLLDLQRELPDVEADASQLQQLIMNLVINGAEAIGEGKTGTVRVTTGVRNVNKADLRQTAHAPETKPGRYVSLEVQDSGCGMDEETKAKIFDPFFTTKFTGRGLGLAAALGIVRSHQGAIKVSSAPGKGSTFQVLFPALGAGAKKRSSTGVKAAELSGKGTILVVDDEEIVRRMAKSALQRYGYAVLVAENGQDAVDVFQALSDRISLVLLDLTMPVMSGEEALSRLQAKRPDVQVILSSGYNEAEATRRFSGKTLAGFIQKPYTAAQLAEKVKTVRAIA